MLAITFYLLFISANALVAKDVVNLTVIFLGVGHYENFAAEAFSF